MLADLEADLGSLLDHSGRVALLTEVLRVLPTEAQLSGHGGFDSLLTSSPSVPSSDGVAERGRSVAEVAALLDGGELYSGVATPARTALSLHAGHEDWAPGLNDLEDEHGLDAITRLVGLGLIAEALSEEDSDGASAAWLNTSSGRASLAWFAAVEVVLAFGTEDEPVDADKVLDLLDTFFDSAIDAWTEHASERSLARARIIVNNWTDALCPVVQAASGRVTSIAAAVRDAIGKEGGADVEALEDEAKALAMYRSLVARHLGEVLHGESPVARDPVQASAPPDVASSAPAPGPPPSASADADLKDTDPDVSSAPSVDPTADRDERLARITSGLGQAREARGEADEALRGARELHAKLGEQLKGLDKQIREHSTVLGTRQEVLAAHRTNRARLTKASGAAANTRAAQSATLSGLTEDLIRAESMLTDAQEVQQLRLAQDASRKEALGQARESCRRAISHQIACVTAVRDGHQGTRDLLATAEEALVHDIGDRIRKVNKGLASAKSRLAKLRKGRRAAARRQQSFAATAGATEEAIAKVREDVEIAVVAVKHATTHLKGLTSKLASSEDKLRKRRHRVDDLEDRQAGADELVQELTDSIGHTRVELDAILSALKQSKKEATARKTKRKKEIRQRLSTLCQQRDECRAALIPLTSEVATRGETIGVKNSACEAAAESLADGRSKLEAIRAAQHEATLEKQRGIELTKAAMDMLRNNAKRLEEAHSALRGAQAAADALTKERNLAVGKKERIAAEIAACRRDEVDAADRIEELERAVGQTQSALERQVGKVLRTQEKIRLARADKADHIREEIEGKRARISLLRERIAEAVEDREGLAVAEVRLDTQTVHAKSARVPLSEKLVSLQKTRSGQAAAMTATQRSLDEMKTRLSTLAMDMDGARLSIRGLEAAVASRRRQVASQQGRLAVLDASIGSAQAREDDAVERVADFQSWVERTQASIARLGTSKPAPPPPQVPPPPPARSEKVDKLLAKLQSDKAPIIPDPSAVPEIDGAATVMVDRQALLEAHREEGAASSPSVENSGDAATEMFNPEELIARLAEEEGDATVVVPRAVRRPKRNRDE